MPRLLMTMRPFLVAALVPGIALVTTEIRADTGRAWLAKLHTQSDPALRGEAAGYALGILAGSAATAGIIDTGSKSPRRPCPPEGTTPSEAARTLEARLQARADWQALPAPIALLLAGLDAYPCAQEVPNPDDSGR